MSIILAIDGGGSRTRCVAVNRAGNTIGEATSGPSNHLLVDKNTVARSLAEAIETCLITAGFTRKDIACLSAGLAGVDYDGTGAAEIKELLAEVGFTEPVINGDMVIAHAGALGASPGVVALSGTGSCVMGIGVNGKRVKVGGWGPVYGDEGSAYRIGEMSLRAAARAYDRSGPATALVQSVTNALGLTDFRETVTRVYVEGMQPREIAALSRVAYETAEAGDEVAREIFLQAGEELADSVISAVRQLELDETLVSYQGSVLESCHLLRHQFIDKLRRTTKVAAVVRPRFEPVMGAYLLGCKALGWPADSEVGQRGEGSNQSK